MMKMCVCAGIFLVFVASAVSAEVYVDTMEIDIVAGDSFVLVYELVGPESSGNMSVTIIPDGEGFNVTYPGEVEIPSSVYVNVSTSSLLQPGNYTIVATFYSDYVQPGGQVRARRVYRYHAATQSVQNQTQNQTVPPDETPPAENETEGKNNHYESGFDVFSVVVGAFFVILFVILGVLLFMKKSKK